MDYAAGDDRCWTNIRAFASVIKVQILDFGIR